MVERRRIEEWLVWTAIGVAAAAAAVACFVPGFELRIEASVGAGAEQRSFDYTTKPAIVDLRPVGLLALGAALVLVACAAAALVRGARPRLVVLAFVLAWGLGLLAFDVADKRIGNGWSEHGVIGYEEPHGGPLLQPALDDLKSRARSSPEAQEPGWELAAEDGYMGRGLRGWDLFAWSAFALVWLTGYRLMRLGLSPPKAVGVVVGAGVVLLFLYFLSALSRYG